MMRLKKIHEKLTAICLFVSFLFLMPVGAVAYDFTVHIDGFLAVDEPKNLTGEILTTITDKSAHWDWSYAYCADRNTAPLVYDQEYYGVSQTIKDISFPLISQTTSLPYLYNKTELLQAAWLMDRYAYVKTLTTLPYKKDGGSFFDQYDSSTAVQLAIWNLLHMSLDRFDGQYAGYQYLFDASENLVSQAQTADLTGLDAKYRFIQLYADAALQSPVQPVLAPVPIPAAGWLLGVGLAGLARLRKERRL